MMEEKLTVAEVLPVTENRTRVKNVLAKVVKKASSGAEPKETTMTVQVVNLHGDEPEFFDKVVFSQDYDWADDHTLAVSGGKSGRLISMTKNPVNNYLPPITVKDLPPDDERFFKRCMVGEEMVSGKVAIQAGDYYADYGEGKVIGRTRDGEEFKALNFTIKFVRECHIYYDNAHFDVKFIIRVTTAAGDSKEVIINSSDYDKVYEIIKRAMPGVFRNTNAKNACCEYFTDAYAKRGTLPIETQTMYSGWHAIEGKLQYYIGINPYFNEVKNPYKVLVAPHDIPAVIRQGLDFLKVGGNGTAICLLFLFAHMAFLRYWLERQGIKFHSTLYLVGPTGSLKTAVASVVANVLDDNEAHKGIRMTSTLAGAKRVMKLHQDTLMLVDDFSNGNDANNNKAENLRYDLTRILADATVETKVDFSSDAGVAAESVRTVAVFTAEEYMTVGQSTELRTISVDVELESFDGVLLGYYQQNPAILQRYFALVIQYLTKTGHMLETGFQNAFQAYRTSYGERYPDLRRVADSTAQLRIAVDIINRFAADNGVDASGETEKMVAAIDAALQKQIYRTEAAKPEKRFLIALWACLKFGKIHPEHGIALSEDEYNGCNADFIGYSGHYDGREAVFIRFKAAWKLVKDKIKKDGEAFYQGEDTIKKLLFRKGIILGIPNIKGTGFELSIKKGKEPRDRMTVFFADAVKKIVETEAN